MIPLPAQISQAGVSFGDAFRNDKTGICHFEACPHSHKKAEKSILWSRYQHRFLRQGSHPGKPFEMTKKRKLSFRSLSTFT